MVAIRTCRKKGLTASFSAFVDALAPLMAITEPTEEALRRTWRIMDDDRRGCICAEDLARVVNKFGVGFTTEEVSDMIDFADSSQNGEVVFEEFCSVFARSSDSR